MFLFVKHPRVVIVYFKTEIVSLPIVSVCCAYFFPLAFPPAGAGAAFPASAGLGSAGLAPFPPAGALSLPI